MNRENGSFIQKWVGWTRENGQHDNGYIAQLLIDNGALGMSWQMTIVKVYGRLTWRFVIGGKSRQRRLSMSEGGYGTDNMDWQKLWEVTRPQEQVDQVGSVEGDV
jgi:hypothetical protein